MVHATYIRIVCSHVVLVLVYYVFACNYQERRAVHVANLINHQINQFHFSPIVLHPNEWNMHVRTCAICHNIKNYLCHDIVWRSRPFYVAPSCHIKGSATPD